MQFSRTIIVQYAQVIQRWGENVITILGSSLVWLIIYCTFPILPDSPKQVIDERDILGNLFDPEQSNSEKIKSKFISWPWPIYNTTAAKKLTNETQNFWNLNMLSPGRRKIFFINLTNVFFLVGPRPPGEEEKRAQRRNKLFRRHNFFGNIFLTIWFEITLLI